MDGYIINCWNGSGKTSFVHLTANTIQEAKNWSLLPKQQQKNIGLFQPLNDKAPSKEHANETQKGTLILMDGINDIPAGGKGIQHELVSLKKTKYPSFAPATICQGSINMIIVTKNSQIRSTDVNELIREANID